MLQVLDFAYISSAQPHILWPLYYLVSKQTYQVWECANHLWESPSGK